MSLTDLANLGEFVGGAVVVFSVVYLALQIRQNTLALRMTAHEHVFGTFRSIISPLKTDERLASSLRRGYRFGSLPPEQQIPISMYYTEVLLHFQNCHVLYLGGALEESTFRAYESYVLSSLMIPGLDAWWRHFRHALAPATVELIESRLREPSGLQRWDELMPWWGAADENGDPAP